MRKAAEVAEKPSEIVFWISNKVAAELAHLFQPHSFTRHCPVSIQFQVNNC
jgi:hypothetical protein